MPFAMNYVAADLLQVSYNDHSADMFSGKPVLRLCDGGPEHVAGTWIASGMGGILWMMCEGQHGE
jgi:hypothetical protein